MSLKIVIQNPQLTSDTFSSGINDYVVEFIRQFNPAIRIWPPYRFRRWLLFLIKKNLPLFGWEYVFSESELKNFDVWMSFVGCPVLPTDKIPTKFSGLKIFHLMDYSFWSHYCADELKQKKVDYLFGYARHDKWCGYFNSIFSYFKNRVIPFPFGYSNRFSYQKNFNERKKKCCVMGAVNPVDDPFSNKESIKEYVNFFKDDIWAHPTRAYIRDNLKKFEEIIDNFMAIPPNTKNLSYNSAQELNNYQFFLNDDSIMHYPPARTFEGTASGSIMVCSDHPCYNDFGWQSNANCITYREGDYDDMVLKIKLAIKNQDTMENIQKASLVNAARFSHLNLGFALDDEINLIYRDEIEKVKHYWEN